MKSLPPSGETMQDPSRLSSDSNIQSSSNDQCEQERDQISLANAYLQPTSGTYFTINNCREEKKASPLSAMNTANLSSAITKHTRLSFTDHKISSIMCPTQGKMCKRFTREARTRASPWNIALFFPRPLFSCLLVTLIMSSCLPNNYITALESAPLESGNSLSLKASNQDPLAAGKAGNSHERSDSATLPAPKSDTSRSSQPSSQSSIVASLSSAVATAAAAAAVAAAQNHLNGNDARSLSSNQYQHGHHAQSQRSPGLNLAIKLADTIPEVPYNILHNMKKVDHAAPFYNVPNKFSSGAPKELSASNFLTNALQASGNFGGAADQLSALFKSPLWKRIADGYGDFASEFRSLFRAPGATPMKGPSSATSKLLRDISVPAIIMLLASSVSGEWRPVRTRRKSFRPVDIANTIQNSAAGGGNGNISPEGAAETLKSVTQYYNQLNERPKAYESQQSPNGPASSAAPSAVYTSPPIFSGNNQWLEQHLLQQQNQVPLVNPSLGQLTRLNNDIDLQPVPHSWNSASFGQHRANIEQLAATSSPAASLGQDQQRQQYLDLQQVAATLGQQQQQQQQQAIARRSDELPTDVGGYGATRQQASTLEAPLNSPSSSALTSPAQMIAKLLNLKADSDSNSYRMLSLLHGGSAPSNRNDFNKMSSTYRNQLDDKRRYSLVGPDELSYGAGSSGDPAKLSSATSTRQPLLLSAMTHAVTSMLNPRQMATSVGGKSGSTTPADASVSAERYNSPASFVSGLVGASKQANLLTRSNLQSLISGDGGGGRNYKTINHEDSVFMRRHPQAAEQRDLTKLLPESWREVVKRTMSTVQQQANIQWKSIEGQLATWVQDKLKTVAASASANSAAAAAAAPSAGLATSPAVSATGSAPAPLGNMLASMSSTALNILGLNKNNSSASPSSAAAATTTSVQAKSRPSSSGDGDYSAIQRGKLEQSVNRQQVNQHQSPLAGMANLVVSSLSNRISQSPASSSHTTSPQNELKQTLKSPTSGEVAFSAISTLGTSVASKYPTVVGGQSPAAVSQSNKDLAAAVLAGAAMPSTSQPPTSVPTSSQSSSPSSS